MIKYETIISNFDDKTTLYNWLRKVEEALKNASATNFVVNKKGNATLSFSITFADGTTLESGDIVLQQGESVDGARIASGVLQLHLTNGTWLTAGNLGAVSGFSINASQHLIVTYQDGTTEDLGAIFSGNVNISGALNVNGAITGTSATITTSIYGETISGGSIIEVMTGYSYEQGTKENVTLTPIYVGACKNGNKLSIVNYLSITRTGSIGGGYMQTGIMYIPSSVGSRLYGDTIAGNTQVLDYRKVNCVKKSDASIVEVNLYVQKYGNGGIAISLTGLNALDQDDEYVVRIENTYLLSDNLAQ